MQQSASSALVYGSVCSGIESATAAWRSLGWRAAFFAENSPFPSAVLAHHYPNVPNLGDMAAIDGREWRGKIDVLVGGTPCQAFSVAGSRRSLDDERGNLTLKFVELADAVDPAWTVWENVPGVLSTRDNAFGCLLGGLAGEDDPLIPAGEKWTNAGVVFGPARTVAWRVLDAQYFGLAQRRKRVFVVAGAREGAVPAEILLERDGLRRDHPPSRRKGEIASALTSCGVGTCGADDNQAQAGHLLPVYDDGDRPRVLAFGGNNTSGPIDIATACNAHGGPCGRMDFESETFVAHSLRGEGFDASEDGTGRGTPLVLAFSCKDHGADAGDVAPTLRAMGCADSRANAGGQVAVAFPVAESSVRRLTPRECERLQGFPDDYTLIRWRGKPLVKCPDGHRYKAIGNSMAVPVMRWIGERIDAAMIPRSAP